jgi:DNA-binding XRE family transcriptional regulator
MATIYPRLGSIGQVGKKRNREMTDKEIEREIQRVRDRLKSLAGEEHGGQSELARAIGVPRQRLFDWITGKSTPDVKAWLKIQAHLKTDGKKKASVADTLDNQKLQVQRLVKNRTRQV